MTVSATAPKTLHAHEQPMAKIFSDDFAFSIPGYQRPYSWTTEHCGDLLDDLVDFMRTDGAGAGGPNPYFLGSIVLIKGLTPESEVVDGQQRLTTLTILLAVLRELADSGKDRQKLNAFVYEEGNEFSGAVDRYRLTLRSRDAEFFREHVQREGGLAGLAELQEKLTDSRKNIRENALHFLSKLESLSPAERKKLGQFILQRCYLVVVSTPDLDSAYRIFSVLNDRGLDLSHTDILKSEIIGRVPDEYQEGYTERWESIEDDLGRGAFQNLFVQIRMIVRKAKAQGTLLEEFRTHVRPKENPRGFVDGTLEPYARAYAEITESRFESTAGADAINAVTRDLGLIDNTDWLAPAIYFLSRHRNDAQLLLACLRDLERLAAGTMIIRANFNNRMERYGRLLRAAERDEDLFREDSPLQLTGDERERILRVLDGDLYNTRIRVPVLLRLDGLVSDTGAEYDRKITTVEHVLPQNPAEGSVWLEWFADEDERSEYTHRLANLVLLSRRKNSQAQNFDFEKKKQQYFQKGGAAPFALTSQVLATSEWTPGVVERRQRELLDMLGTAWRL